MNFFKKNKIIKQCFFEFFGTGLIIFCGTSCMAILKLTNLDINHFEISLTCGLGVFLAMYLSSSISGAHLNPAITIFFWLSSQFNKKKVLPYILSQVLGSFFFTMFVYCLYSNLLGEFEKKYHIVRGEENSIDLASIFCIYPNNQNSFLRNFSIEICITAVFMMMLLIFNNHRNVRFFKYNIITPILVGLLIFMINFLIIPIDSISLNPARDLGSKIFLSISGWGMLAFTGGNKFFHFLIPIIGPIFGINLGGWIYKVFFDCKNDKNAS